MIKEFALEPRLLDNWKDFRYFVEQFGVSRGRLISRYPRRWKRLVYEALRRCPDGEKKKIEVALCTIDKRLLPRIHEWDPHLAWLPNAIAEHEKRSFDGIVARENPGRHSDVLVGDDVSEHDPRWRAHPQRDIRRDGTEIAASVAPLVHAAKEIRLVEPHLRPQLRRFRDPLKEIFKCLSSQRVPYSRLRLELHTGDRVEVSEFRRQCEAFLPAVIPRGVELRIVRWSQADLHNRFVLTDLGSAMFGTGLDEARITGTRDDKVVLLEDEQHQAEWDRFRDREPLCIIVGTAMSRV